MEQDTQSAAPANGTAPKAKAPSQPRPDKALPTDRLKFGQQVNALKAISVASVGGTKAVGAEDIAPRIGVVAATAGLNNQFFMESGLITRESKGRYKPTEAVERFARKHTFDAEGSGRELAGILGQTWYFQAVRQQLEMGTTPTQTMIRVLADAAGAVKAHEVKLASLLAWLEFAGLVTTEGGTVKIPEGAPEPPAVEDNELPDPPPADTEGKRTTEKHRRQPPADTEAVLSFSFDFALTADDLKALSPEQIQKVFEAVGQVMAVKAAIKT